MIKLTTWCYIQKIASKQKEHFLRIKDETLKNQSTFIPIFQWAGGTFSPVLEHCICLISYVHRLLRLNVNKDDMLRWGQTSRYWWSHSSTHLCGWDLVQWFLTIFWVMCDVESDRSCIDLTLEGNIGQEH